MRAFMESNERFLIHLRPQDVLKAVRLSGVREALAQAEIDSALMQLSEWGNLQWIPDPTEMRTPGDFHKQRQVLQITQQGKAAERAFAYFDTVSGRYAQIQGSTAFADIVHVLRELRQLSRDSELDAGRAHRNLLVLKARFEDLTATAHILIGRLERTDVPASEIRRLADCGEQFIGELVIAADCIGETVRDIDEAGLERLLQAVAEHTLRDGIEITSDDIAAVCGHWRSHWKLFCKWFISQPDRVSNAEVLRERIRASIPVLLRLITSVNDREIYRVDRSNDFRVLARWFAQAESDAEAHRLWRALFGLCPARHLIVNDATLDECETGNVPANTSWLDAPPLRIPVRVRDRGSNSQPALSRIIDRAAEKEKLAAATREETFHILNGQARFGTGGRTRLSEFEGLEPGEFDLFLDLLAEALSARVFPTEPVEIVSGDGSLRIKLEPTGDGQEALILTSEGIFSGPDHWISVERISTEEVLI
jgi:uncharacterized protein (TIGR02677 family)